MITFRYLVGFALATTSLTAAANDLCKELLKGGVFDTQQRYTARSHYASLRTLYCSDAARTYKAAQGLNLGIDLDGIMASFGYKAEQYEQWRETICKSEERISDWRSFEYEQSSKASGIIAKTFADCVTGTPGIQQYIRNVTDNDRQFLWFLKFAPGEGDKERSVTVTLNLPSGVTCDKRTIELKREGGAQPLRCTRSSCGGEALSVNSKPQRSPQPEVMRLLTIREVEQVLPPPSYDVPITRSMTGKWDAQVSNDSRDRCEYRGASNNNWCAHKFGRDECGQPEPCANAVPKLTDTGLAVNDFDPNSYGDDNGTCTYYYRCQPPAKASKLVRPQWCRGSQARTVGSAD